MSISVTRISFRIGDLLKTSRPGHHMFELVFDAFVPDRRVCVLTTSLHYLDRTKDIRGNTTRFFLTTKPPIKLASRDTIRRWTKDVMRDAGIDLSQFSPHSTRSASSSKAALRLPLSTILSSVGWTNESTFAKYCRRSLNLHCQS